MKFVVLALALSAASDPHSLGIGLDVLPEAFAVAARRVHAPEDLGRPTCSPSGCRWNYGSGVVIDARLLEGTLSLVRIEAIGPAIEPGTSARYRDACRAIVALVEPNLRAGERIATVDAIARGGEDPGPSDPVVSLYGRRAVGAGDPELRCGATVE